MGRVFLSDVRMRLLREQVEVLRAGVGSVIQLCRLLNDTKPAKSIYPNRVHTLLTGQPNCALNPNTVFLIETAVKKLAAARPDLVKAGRVALAETEEPEMAEVNARSQYTVKLEQSEFRLICLGLSGKLKGKDALEAMELNVKLLELRQGFLDDVAKVSLGAVEKARQELEEMKAQRKPKEADETAS